MTEREIVNLIGKPLYVKPNYRPVPEGTPPDQAHDGTFSWVYGVPGRFDGGLEISLRIDSGVLMAAGAELHDFAVYHCDRAECPVIVDAEAMKCLPEKK